jgi:hypothetical protein
MVMRNMKKENKFSSLKSTRILLVVLSNALTLSVVLRVGLSLPVF